MTLKEKKELVSIIIPTFNRRKDAETCLKSIFNQSYAKKEIIIVDDHSTDDTTIYIRKKFPTIKVLENKQNKGPNYCRNLGIINSQGEYILILDSDVELVNKDQIKNMVMIMDTNSKIGSLGGCYLPNDRRIRACQISGASFLNPKKPDFKIKGLALKECDWIGTNNLFMKKDLLYKFKGFDETTVGGETDFEMGMNLKQRGFKNLFGKEIALKHTQSSSERNNIGIKSRADKNYLRELWRMRNRIKYLIKNKPIIDQRTKRNIISFNLLRVPKQLIAILAFLKQQFLGLPTKDSPTTLSFKIKLKTLFLEITWLFFYVWLIFDSYTWNVVNYRQIIKLRNINFLSERRWDNGS